MSQAPQQIANAIRRAVTKQGSDVKLRSAEVTAVASGLVTVQKVGAGTSEGDYARLIPAVPKTGSRVALAKMGGAELVLGVISRVAETLLDLGAPIIGQSYAANVSASAATTATTTSNTTYATVRALTWSDLPDGTYDIFVDWSATFSDSSSGSINFRLKVGSTTDTVFTLGMTTTRETIRFARTFSAVVVAGGITITAEYKRDSGSGTASARNPALSVIAIRKG